MRWTFQTGRSKRNDKFPTCSTLMDCNRRDSVSVLSRVVFLPELMAKFISECSHVVQEYFEWQMTSLGHLEAGQTGALSLSSLSSLTGERYFKNWSSHPNPSYAGSIALFWALVFRGTLSWVQDSCLRLNLFCKTYFPDFGKVNHRKGNACNLQVKFTLLDNVHQN